MKEKYSSIENEPALQGGNFQLDPSEEKVARKAAAQGQKTQAEIDRIRDSVANEPALMQAGDKANPEEFKNWLESKRAGVGYLSAFALTIVIGFGAGLFAIVGALSKGPGMSLGIILYAILFAPIIEEFLKQIGMVFVLERKPYLAKSAWQFPIAAVIAAAIFATIENLTYIHVYAAKLPQDQREALARFRWPICTALHVSCAFIASFGLVKVWNKQNAEGKPAQLSDAFPAFAIGMAIHGLYNFAATFFIKIGESTN